MGNCGQIVRGNSNDEIRMTNQIALLKSSRPSRRTPTLTLPRNTGGGEKVGGIPRISAEQNQIRSTKFETNAKSTVSDIRISNLIRHSNFVIRIFLAAAL